MKAVALRRATLEDAADIGALHVASWRETYAGILPEEMLNSLSVESRTAMWRGLLADPDTHPPTAIFVAEEEGRTIGFGACGAQRDKTLRDAGFGGEIGALYILRAHQKSGVGRALMKALAGALSRQELEGAALWVLRENGQARAFYKALGGEIVGEKSSEEPGATFVEVAYGWRDLSRLAGAASAT